MTDVTMTHAVDVIIELNCLLEWNMFRSGSQKGGWVCVFSAVQERNEGLKQWGFIIQPTVNESEDWVEGSGCDIFCGSVGSGSMLPRVQVMSVAASFKQLMVNLVILHPQFKNLRVLVCGGTKQDIGRHIWKTAVDVSWESALKFNFSLARFYKWWLKCALKVIVLSRSRVRAEEGFTFSISPNTFIRSLNWTHSAAIFSDITVLDPQSDNVCVTCQPPTVSIFSSAHVTLTSMWLCQNNLIGSEDAITTTCSPVRPLWWFSQARKRFLSRLRKPRIILQHSFIFFPNNMQLHNSPEGLPHLVVRYLSLLNSCLEAVWLSVYHERMFLHVQHKHPSHARPHRVWKAFRGKVKQSHARTDESNDRSLKCAFIEYFNRCTLKPFSALTQTFIQRCVCRQHTERVVKINRKWVRESAEKPNALTLISHN